MYRLVYVSTATRTMRSEDLNAILDVSRAKNRRLGITGMLLHIDSGFLQVLEGPKEAVTTLFATIGRDLRHHGVQVLIEQEADERLFGDWSMGFDRPTAGRSADVFAITRDAIEGTIAPEKAAEIAILLRNFYRVNAGNGAS